MQRHIDNQKTSLGDDMIAIPTKQDVMNALVAEGPGTDVPVEWVLDKFAEREGKAS